jgi:hypothetical protein
MGRHALTTPLTQSPRMWMASSELKLQVAPFNHWAEAQCKARESERAAEYSLSAPHRKL